MIGQIYDHYRIVEELGGGSMGVVYRAEDTRLERTVALKFLPPELIREPAAKARFLREARAASRLDHPNICTVHEIRETAEGGLFIVMAYYRGETLQKRLERGPLPLAEAVHVAQQIAYGLAKAHSENVAHRDVKPANVMLLEGGPLKLLDFGLAKVTGDATLTRAGSSLGTPRYMSPEHILGEADKRSDLWSLGVLLYEMVTGERPFRGENASAVIYSILHHEPKPIAELARGVPPELAALTAHMLAKDPEERVASADDTLSRLTEIAAALPAVAGASTGSSWDAITQAFPLPRRPAGARRWPVLSRAGPAAVLAIALLTAAGAGWLGLRRDVAVTIPTSPGRASLPAIAVLPFDDLSQDSSQTFFADGMTEALITGLAKVSGLRVISRASAMSYKDAAKPIPQIARELSVDYLLQGSVLRAENEVRISTQLVDGESDQVLWSESYQRPLEGILALQGAVARAVVEQIQVRLTPREATALATAAAVDPQAFDLYLEARAAWNERTSPSLRRAADLFERAIAIDPGYALAYVGLAESYQLLGEIPFHAMPTREADSLAQLYSRRALELDPSSGEAYATLAMVDAHRWNWRDAEEKFQRAVALSPSYATAYQWFGETLLLEKRWDEARQALWQAELLDPLSPIIRGQLGRLLIYRRQARAAADHFRALTVDFPGFWLNHYGLAMASLELGDEAEALRAGELALELSGGSEFAELNVAMIRAFAGEPAPAEALLERQGPQGSHHLPPTLVANLAVSLGDRERALRELERGLEEGDSSLPFVNVDPVFDPLREEARFRDILRKIGLEK